MRKSLSILSAALVTSLKKLLDLRRTVAFRLSLYYAGIFTVSLAVAFLLFYYLVLRGSHGFDRAALSAIREDFREYFATGLVGVILFSTLIGWFMARKAMSGVDEVTRIAVAISQGELDKRVPIGEHKDEIDRLAQTFNNMLDRIQALVRQMTEITDNIAHDLRSPITRIRGLAEITLGNNEWTSQQARTAATIIGECDRLLEMINTMLDISDAEAGLARLNLEEIDIGALLQDAGELFQPWAEDKQITLTIEAAEPLHVQGDLAKLQRICANLLDNALKYTPSGGRVRVSAARDREEVSVTVEDTGCGIPEEDLPHVFDRFFRGEKSRSTQGNGLGLTLARAFVVAHGGRITAFSSSGKGAAVTVVIPLNPTFS